MKVEPTQFDAPTGHNGRPRVLAGVGASGRQRLREARVLVVGVGGLGTPAALYLANAGVGTIGLIDPDVVEVSNLQRQILYTTADLGRRKVESAAAVLRARNADLVVQPYAERLTAERLPEVFDGYEFVVDGTDGVASKFLVNDGAVLTGTPYVHAGALGWIGQVMTVLPERSACYRCLFPSPPDEEEVPTCQMAGIVGAVVGTIGVVQATEALKYLLELDGLLTNRMLTYDALAMRWRSVAVSRNPACPLCGPRRSIRSLEDAADAMRTGEFS